MTMQNTNPLIVKGIASNKSVFTGPETVQIDLTGMCNNSCVGCWVHSPYIKNPPRDKFKQLPLQAAKALIRDLHGMGTKQIVLSGSGEPLLYPHIIDIITLIKQKGFSLNIITNALLLTEDISRQLVSSGVDLITASIWAGCESSYIKTHPGKNSEDFHIIKENLKNLNKLKSQTRTLLPKLKVYNVICNLNSDDIMNMIDFALDAGSEEIEFQVMDIIDGETSFLSLSGPDIKNIDSQLVSLEARDDLYFKELRLFSKVKEEEIKEFCGRFFRTPAGFFVDESIKIEPDKRKSALRILTCQRGFSSTPTRQNPVIDEKNNRLVFSMPKSKCKKCPLFGKTCLIDSNGQLSFRYLRIAGYGSFIRKLRSSGIDSHIYEKDIINNIPCYSGWLYSRILSTGEVSPCCKGADKILGNINRDKFSSIWGSPLYQDFRFKAKNILKDNSYFEQMNCSKSCDMVSINIGLNAMLEDKKCPAQAPAALKKNRFPFSISPGYSVKIPAGSFQNGNLNNQSNNFGRGIVVDGGEGLGFAEYKFNILQAARYEFWACYASKQARPVRVYLDNNIFLDQALADCTGGWNGKSLLWLYQGSVEIKQGSHILKIYTEGFIPHIYSFAFKKADRSPINSTENALFEKVYITPRPMGVFLNKIKTAGIARSLLKALSLNKIKSFFDDYLDIIGILGKVNAFKGPHHVQIDITDYCNNNCIACWCNSPLLGDKARKPEEKRTLPLSLVKELIDDLAREGTRELYFSGSGEPFCHPDIMDILCYAKEKGFVCYVNTNFTLLSKDKIDRLIEIGLDHLTVSTWSATTKTYARTHPNKSESTFLGIQENLSYLNKTKNKTPYVKLYNVIFKENFHEILEMVDFARKTGCESVEYTLIDTIPGKTESLLLSEGQIKSLQARVRELSSKIDKKGCIGGVVLFNFDSFRRRVSSSSDLALATYDRNIIDRIPCYIGWCFARILPNGDVNSCLKAHRIPAGNLYEGRFQDIWNCKRQLLFREKTLTCKKTDSFFRLIGNDPDTKEAGCYKSCDDIGRNIYMHNRIMSLTSLEKLVLRLIARFKAFTKKQSPLKNKNQDLILKGIIHGRKAFSGPEHVTLDITNRCNQDCIGCWMYSPFLKNRPCPGMLNKELDIRKVKALICSLADMGTRRIRFTGGGEPFLHPDIMDAISYAKEKGLICAVTTNFSLLDKKGIKRIIDLGLDELAISIWASNKQVYRKTHPSAPEGLFEIIRGNIDYLLHERKSKPFVTLCNVVCRYNYENIYDMYDFAKNIGADGIYFTPLDPVEGTREFLIEKNQINSILSQTDLILEAQNKPGSGKKVHLDNFNGFISRLKHGNAAFGEYDLDIINSNYPCYAGWFFTRILADGSVVPCCRGVKKIMGNINTDDFRDIWNNADYNTFRVNAKYMDKRGPYFVDIGCFKTCDNMMHNQEIAKRLKLL